LQLIAEGHTSKEIAQKLGITYKTAESHRDHIMRKLDIHSSAGLTKYAIAAGIVKLE
jgi:DNA-binding CsgD family transcriptional regulator